LSGLGADARNEAGDPRENIDQNPQFGSSGEGTELKAQGVKDKSQMVSGVQKSPCRNDGNNGALRSYERFSGGHPRNGLGNRGNLK